MVLVFDQLLGRGAFNVVESLVSVYTEIREITFVDMFHDCFPIEILLLIRSRQKTTYCNRLLHELSEQI